MDSQDPDSFPAAPHDAPDLALLLALEEQVWQAQVRGDADAERELLSEDFVGVTPAGILDLAAHLGELDDGPITERFALSQARVLPIAPDAALLVYRAEHRAAGGAGRGAEAEVAFISSLWQRREGRWWNTFSQDVPAGTPTS
ncbi:nuclear transport factor 2 family protein [Brachybacterium aquaticum]|uniref:DUF4440 domain-containing protein n=1 Tax=Brachybacterium aquaticum TaxID=1432564 RepID=A0A841AAT4_9MICO|nr:nuclear transport factor 2 family protein [Brachybacterium aquaticum]MBB5830741.1 hypothetical protein [Brachybacterium aquaticum]